jgi:lysophospholipase L1-like esterase
VIQRLEEYALFAAKCMPSHILFSLYEDRMNTSSAITLSLLVGSIMLGSITLASVQCTPQPEQQATNKSDTLTYLALGDSYTIAQGLPTKDSWSVQLAERIRASGTHLNDPLIIARTGWRTDQLLNAVRQAQNSLQIVPAGYDLVSLLIGVNNQYQGGTEELFRVQFASLLQMSIIMARGKSSRVIVLSIPDYSVSPFAATLNRSAIAAAIDRFNAIKREECKKVGVAFVDITPLSREAKNRQGFFASDGLHPSREQYAEWTKLALPVALEALNR